MLYRGAVALRTAGALNHVSKSDWTVISGSPATGCMASSQRRRCSDVNQSRSDSGVAKLIVVVNGSLLETGGQFVAATRASRGLVVAR